MLLGQCTGHYLKDDIPTTLTFEWKIYVIMLIYAKRFINII